MNSSVINPRRSNAANPATILASETKSRVQSLDCLRAVACLIVILSHTSRITTPGGWTIGSYGVGLFCVLSGYLISSLLLQEEKRNKNIAPIKFLQRRCLRIAPAYFMVLLSCTLLMQSGLFFKNHPELISMTLSDFIYFATFTHNSGDGFAINHLWSISVEEQFYCLLPMLFLVTKSRKIRQVILVLAALFMSQYTHSENDFNAAFIPLIVGTLLALNFDKVTFGLNVIGTSGTLMCSLLLIIASIILRACPYGPLCSVSFLLLVWTAIAKFKHSNQLSGLAYIGTISYGVYLVHMPLRLVIFWILDHLGLRLELLSFALTTLTSIGVAALSWELFERRILSLRDRIPNTVMGISLACLSPVLITIGLLIHALHRL